MMLFICFLLVENVWMLPNKKCLEMCNSRPTGISVFSQKKLSPEILGVSFQYFVNKDTSFTSYTPSATNFELNQPHSTPSLYFSVEKNSFVIFVSFSQENE
jgi:hypothetical protein